MVRVLLFIIFAIGMLSTCWAQCVYSVTECSCKKETSGNMCLQYFSGSTSSEICESYECGSGYGCDCTGSEMCDIGSCDSNAIAYQPVETTVSSLGQLVSCTSTPKKQCIYLRTTTTTPSPSASATPSQLVEIQAAPAASATPTATSTTTATPTPSTSSFCNKIDGPLINEFFVNALAGVIPAETNFEIRGEAGKSFSGHITFIRYSTQLFIHQTNAVSGTFDSNGLLVVAIPDATDPTFTVVLSTAFTGSVNDLVDNNNDGNVDDTSIFGTVLDAVGVPINDGEEETHTVASSIGGTDFQFVAGTVLIFRDSCIGQLYSASSAGTISDSSLNEFAYADFTGSVFTNGAVNPANTKTNGS